ncbi:unnamed protein product [Polarella glacialis]|uniref:Uncharacterized protein n=1 Tax=Polarella glacialis TaxID=89957 RepID=A0A813DAK3_POLGL|nr:unnamed protein product [Polarella glacialis]
MLLRDQGYSSSGICPPGSVPSSVSSASILIIEGPVPDTRTVTIPREQMAAYPSESSHHSGMSAVARALQDRALAWGDGFSDAGSVATQLRRADCDGASDAG